MAGKLSAFFGAQDMTVGNPATNLIRFSTPLLIGNLAHRAVQHGGLHRGRQLCG